jgi:hypothetical protein
MTRQAIQNDDRFAKRKESNMKFYRAMIAVALFCATLFGASTARADGWPGSIAGDWNVIGNLSGGPLKINQFAGTPGSQCKPIRGFIYTSDRIEGFYCPNSGRIAFVRYIGNSNNPKQVWFGNVSQVGTPLRMGGTFAAIVHNNTTGTAGGSLGEYNFEASK